MDNVKFIDLYLCVKNNKELFDSKLDEYWKIVREAKKINDGRKLDGVDTGGSEYHINNNIISATYVKIAGLIDARGLIDGSDLEKFAFAWYCSADLINSTKYFAIKHMWRCGEGDAVFTLDQKMDKLVFNDPRWGSKSFLHFAEGFLADGYHNDRRGSDRIVKSIRENLSIDITKEILPKGFSDYVNKKNAEKNENDIIKNVKNKMDLMVWKKQLKNKPITEKHFTNCATASFSGEFWFEKWNAMADIDGLMDKKYFSNYFFRNLNVGKIKNLNAKIARLILQENIGGASYSYNTFRKLSILENINFELTGETALEFFNSNEFKEVMSEIDFDAHSNNKHNDQERTFFTKERFVRHLRSIYNL